jgi:hypothetical protein
MHAHSKFKHQEITPNCEETKVSYVAPILAYTGIYQDKKRIISMCCHILQYPSLRLGYEKYPILVGKGYDFISEPTCSDFCLNCLKKIHVERNHAE